MKFSSVGCFLLLITVAATEASNSTLTKTTNSKVAEKVSYPKKVSHKKNSSKATLKKLADISEKFKDLPADDLTFIKELDKQFKLHGGKVKIKVENTNTTENKNSKRTIEGELGYGYAHNGYEYNAPKFMFYPYSQQHIANNAPKYYLTGDDKTEVSIEPSYSYELKPQTFTIHKEPQIDVPKLENQHHQSQQQHLQQQQQQYEEPVIILRIPGPAKYATHLQMLLQQYLEIRAAQYLRILEEAEQKKQQEQQDHLQQLDYNHGNTNVAEDPVEQVQDQHQNNINQVPEKPEYQQQEEYDHHVAVTPQHTTLQHSDIDNVYQSYQHKHSIQSQQLPQTHNNQQAYYATQQSEEEQQQHPPQYQQQDQQFHYQPISQQPQENHYQQEQEHPQFYYTHEQQYAQPEGPPANTYHQVYLLAMAPHATNVQDQPNSDDHSSSLPISENNPGIAHTKVVFTHNNNEHSHQDYQMYQLPSIKPNERYPPTSVPNYHQDFQTPQYQHLQEKQDSQESSLKYQQQQQLQQQHYSTVAPTNEEVVAITQRPYNYHAHSVKGRARGRVPYKRRVSSKDHNQNLQKIRDYVRDKLGAETGSAVEFKTTQVVVDG